MTPLLGTGDLDQNLPGIQFSNQNRILHSKVMTKIFHTTYLITKATSSYMRSIIPAFTLISFIYFRQRTLLIIFVYQLKTLLLLRLSLMFVL